MTEYGAQYFDARQADEQKRAAMRAQELDRVRAITGLEEGTVVDVGCGLGELLDLLPADRWRKYGIEPSEDAREICRGKGISFELPEREEWCDLVLLRGSLQHLDRPIATLFAAYRWLRPGGWLVALATPNAGGPVYALPGSAGARPAAKLRRLLRRRPSAVPRQRRLPRAGGTPYVRPVRDHVGFLLRLLGVRTRFAFGGA